MNNFSISKDVPDIDDVLLENSNVDTIRKPDEMQLYGVLQQQQQQQQQSGCLLPRPLAAAVSTVSTITRLSLKTADFISQLLFSGAKYGASSCLNASKAAVVRGIDMLDSIDTISRKILYGRSSLSEEDRNNIYLKLLSIAVNQGFSTVEYFVESGIETLNDYSSSTFRTADDFIHLLDGIFGSNETSTAVSVFLSLVRQEIFTDHEDSPSIATLGINNLIKSALAYTILQVKNRNRILNNVSHKVLLTVYVDKQTGSSSATSVQEQLRILLGSSDSRSMPSTGVMGKPDVISWDNNYKSVSRSPSIYGITDSIPHLKPFHESFSHIVQNLSTFSRMSSAIYGRQFLRLLSIASYPKPPRATFDCYGKSHPESHVIFASHSQIALEDIVGSSFLLQQELLSAIPKPQIDTPEFIISVDDSRRLVVATLRGTFGLSDVLTSLTCQIVPFCINENTYLVHSGMMMQAETLAKKGSAFHSIIKKHLDENEEYGLVLNGHSLGGGVCSLIGLLWSNLALDKQSSASTYAFCTSDLSGLAPDRPIHVYVFGSPCVMCDELSRAVRGLVTSVVHQYDFISRLSLGGVRDLKQIAHLLSEEYEREKTRNICDHIISKMIKNNEQIQPEQQQITSSDQRYPESEVVLFNSTSCENRQDEERVKKEENDWYWSVHSALIASSSNQKLYPPGDVYWITSEDSIPLAENGRKRMQKDDSFDKKSDSMTSKVNSTSTTGSYKKFNVANPKEMCVLNIIQIENVESIFGEMQFSSTMILDHSPGRYEWVLSALGQQNY